MPTSGYVFDLELKRVTTMKKKKERETCHSSEDRNIAKVRVRNRSNKISLFPLRIAQDTLSRSSGRYDSIDNICHAFVGCG